MSVYSDGYVAWIEAEAKALSAHRVLCRGGFTGSAAELRAELDVVSALRIAADARFEAMMSEHKEKLAALHPLSGTVFPRARTLF
ncbi:hypothetical protein M2282_005373 [Variovorax boronicumulans]|uniref:hypothetical protein n=1 Tax=Variovorax boronicumulans TaxID=436515 RepID=UPI0024759C50|nr:hypothetical protein [Variovorax boronicumulans]MDH6170203.1 hypothetical protein [Variovorax boronicumulans]